MMQQSSAKETPVGNLNGVNRSTLPSICTRVLKASACVLTVLMVHTVDSASKLTKPTTERGLT
jgi:hypothetical protein